MNKINKYLYSTFIKYYHGQAFISFLFFIYISSVGIVKSLAMNAPLGSFQLSGMGRWLRGQ